MSRWLTWLSGLQLEAFCEVSPELAKEAGLNNGGWATLRSPLAEIETRAGDGSDQPASSEWTDSTSDRNPISLVE
jgi:hypothetical protein